MSNIEWHDTEELEPVESSLEIFCRQNNVSWSKIRSTDGLIVLVEKKALQGLYDFLAHDTQREHGGVLVGRPYFDKIENRQFVVVQSAIPALETEGSSVHLQFTPQAWEYISGLIEEEYPSLVIVGWYHSHPGLGVFMSGTDRATQKAFYNHTWSIATVVDPIAHKSGWFYSSDCFPLGHENVIAYEEPVVQKPVASPAHPEMTPEEAEYLQSESFDRLRWLLPIGLLMLSFLIGVWYLGRDRS